MTDKGSSAVVVCVGVVCRRDESLLLVQRKNPPGAGRWSLPGGRLEAHETLAEGAAREALEETGLSVAIGELAGTAVREAPGGGRYLIYDFFATPRDLAAEPHAGDDAMDCAFVSTARFDVLLVDRLEEWLREHRVI